ncbi:MAG: MFS transporter [Steroidobacteraceae bacterium]|nr:MFS transporter [Steroidobacteraceae bacterium]
MQNKTIEVTGVVDSAKFFGMPLGITVLTILCMLVDGFDLQTMAFVGPALVTDWGIDRALLTPAMTGGMIGMAIGSVTLGWAGDRIGRKGAYVICMVFLFAGSILSAYAQGVWDLTAYRILTGIGLGGVTPLAATMITEWTPKKSRNVAVACAIVAVPLGGMVGAGIAQWIIPTHGWRAIFLIGAVMPFIFTAVAWFLLPETPKFLAHHPEQHPKLAKLLNRLLKEKRFDGTESFVVAEPPAPPGNWFATIMKPPYTSVTLLLWAAFAFNTLCLYSYVNWLPTVLSYTGLPLHTSLQGSKLFNFGGFFGAVGGAVLIGILGSRIVGSTLSFIGGVATFFVGMLIASTTENSAGGLLFLIFIAGTALNGMQAFLYAVGAHSYPTYIRASGVGCAQTVSRIGGVLSTFVGGTYFAIEPTPPAGYFFFFVAACILVVVVSFFSLRTHIPGKKKLEALQAQESAQALQKSASP